MLRRLRKARKWRRARELAGAVERPGDPHEVIDGIAISWIAPSAKNEQPTTLEPATTFTEPPGRHALVVSMPMSSGSISLLVTGAVLLAGSALFATSGGWLVLIGVLFGALAVYGGLRSGGASLIRVDDEALAVHRRGFPLRTRYPIESVSAVRAYTVRTRVEHIDRPSETVVVHSVELHRTSGPSVMLLYPRSERAAKRIAEVITARLRAARAAATP